MTKLTNAQRTMLEQAAAREDGAVDAATGKKASASKVAASLVVRKLLRETRAKRGAPIWRMGENGKGVALTITRAGRALITPKGVQEVATPERALSAVKNATAKIGSGEPAAVAGAAPIQSPRSPEVSREPAPRAGSKQALVIAMLTSETGATLDALVEATGWLPHTTRAALTGLRKKGYEIERARMAEQGASTYRISPPRAADGAAA
jgi:hypothetical protein